MTGGETATRPAKPVRRTNPYVYGLGMLGLTIPGQMFAMYSPYFYNSEKLGLSLALISLGNIFFTIWDALNDPLMGFLSDRTRTRIGRRKPWLLFGIPLYCLCFILFFSPPEIQSGSMWLFFYFTIFLMLTETISTINGTNYHALFPELFQTNKERTSANAFRQALQLVGMIIGMALVPKIIDFFTGGNEQKALQVGYPYTAVLLVVLGMGFLLAATLGSHERQEYWQTSTPGLKESFKAVARNRNFWTVSVTNFFYQATAGMLLVAIPFFVKYTLNLGNDTTILLASVFVTAIPFMWFWRALIRKWGPLKVWRIALACLGLSVIPMFFVSTLLPASIAGAFIGISIAGVTANIDLINAKIIDEDAAKSGLRREAIYQSTISFVIRFSGLTKSLVFILVAAFFGFVDANNPGPQPAMAARFMITVFPVVLMALSVAASFFVKFNEEGVKND
jgi:GPH family glycoside/pentoside/hexuronide:cation symporter